MVSSIPEFLCHQMNIVFHFFLAISFITQISEANQLFWHHDIDNLFQNFLGQLDRTTQVCKVKGVFFDIEQCWRQNYWLPFCGYIDVGDGCWRQFGLVTPKSHQQLYF